MELDQAKEIIELMPAGRTPFYYYKDRYAPFLLKEVAAKVKTVAQLKASPFSGLCNKPIIRDYLSGCGDGRLDVESIDLLWKEPSKAFLLGLSTWYDKDTSWAQTTRRGANLVLQLNFSNQHDALFRKLIKPDLQRSFKSWGHPVMWKERKGYFRETLAWARIDLDLDSGEALIEEIQNDWLRLADAWRRCFNCRCGRACRVQTAIESRKGEENARAYLEQVLPQYREIWDEAMLTACLWFLRRELGVHRIYYHTAEHGARLKSIIGRQPPRSLYTRLPRRFCFRKTGTTPLFLQQDRYFRNRVKRNKWQNIEWQVLDMENHHATH